MSNVQETTNKKPRIAIDSCVFFNMLDYNDLYNKTQSKREVLKEIESDKKVLSIYTNTMNGFIDKYFNTNSFNDDVSLDLKIKPTIDHLKNSIETIQRKMNGNINTLNKPNLPDSRKATLENIVKEQNESLNLYKKALADFVEIIAQYDKLKAKCNVSDLFVKLMNNEVDVFIPSYSFDEIKLHIKEDKTKNNVTNLREEQFFPRKSINNLLSKCNPININTRTFKDHCKKVSKILRGDDKNYPQAMKPETNSANKFGDSLVMAECNIAGIILVTQNRKDFIYDGQKDIIDNKVVNDSRRQIMKNTFNSISYCTDALAYSVEEYLNGKSKDPTKQTYFSKKFNTQEKVAFENLEMM